MAIVSEQTTERLRVRRGSLFSLLLLAVIAALASSARLDAQPITVATQVFPPYSPYLSDYVGFDNKILITLTNTSDQDESIRLVGSISGNNGVKITIPNSYVPNNPILVPANGVKVLKGSDLQNYLNADNLAFSGVTKAEVVQGNGLPEGNYSFCLQALDYNDASVLSAGAPNGCAYFPIAHVAPPETLTPTCEATIDPVDPQSILFSWTLPPGAPPADLEYVLTLVEILPENTPPTQAMNAAPNPPFFEKVVAATTTYQYGPGDPQLEEGMSYAFRVTVRARQGVDPIAFQNEGESAVCSFTWGGEGDLVDNDDDDPDNNDDNIDLDENYVSDCQSLNCAPESPAETESSHVYQIGDEVQIGYFIMTITDLSDPSAGSLTGEGTIDAPIFQTQLKTEFTGLQVNAEHKVYAGEAIGAYDPGAQVDQALQNFQENLTGLTEEKIETVSSFVEQNQKYVEQFVDIDAKGLPFGISDIIDSKLQLITIAAVKFAPDGARLNAVMEFPIPEAEDGILAFAQKNVCFHPTGLSIDGLQKLTMINEEKTFEWGPNVELTLKQAQGQNDGTFVKWDCEGFKGLQVDGYFTFDSELIEKTEGNGDVTAEFTMNAGSWGDLLGEVTMDEFTVAGMQGLSFGFEGVILDFSDTRNAQSMDFPEGYQGSQDVDWKGFFFEEITVTLPEYLKKQGNTPATVTLTNGLINRLGFSGKVTASPLFAIDEGTLGGWGFSIDNFALEFVNNALVAGEFDGKVQLPVAENGIAYSCLLSNSDQGVATDFSVSYLDEIVVDMWGATLTLFEGSTFGIETEGNDVTVEAILSGELTIDKSFPEMKSVNVKIPDVEFQELTIRNKAPYLSATSFAFASPEKSFAGFPVSIAPDDGIEIKFKDGGTKAGLALGFQVGLDGNGESAISGGTNFTIWGKMTNNDGKQSWTIDKPELNSIWIDASVAAADIKGEINLYNGDEKFGDGFRGALEVTFRPLVSLSATVQFGSTKYQNGDERYRYWYVDAMAVMQAGIMVSPGFGIYGFGGGAYYHMKPVNSLPGAASLEGDPNAANDFDQEEAGASSSGTTYEPDPNIAFGFKGTIVMGTMPTPKAFNGDITIEASFFEGGGLNEISLIGNGYFVADLDPKKRPSPDKAIISASVGFRYSGANKTFDGIIDLFVNLKAGKQELIVGEGQAAIHFSKEKWFIKIGTPEKPVKFTVLDLLKISTYMMVGKNSLGPLPPLPTDPINFQAIFPTFNDNNPRDPAAENGSGFATGMQLSINTGDMKFLIFYARLAIAFGFDVSVLKENLECADAEGGVAGMNGWYARGQVYTGIEAEVGLDINLWFIKAKIPILELGLYAALKAGLPNPTWMEGQIAGYYSVLDGLLSGHCTFKFHYGSKCAPPGDPFGDLKVIADLEPGGNDVDVFSYPDVAFNLPLNKAIAVQGVNDKGESVTSYFRFGLREFDVTQVRKNGQNVNNPVAGSASLYADNQAALFEPEAMLDEHSRYRSHVKVYGDRIVDGQWVRITTGPNSNTEHVETRTRYFNTGAAPETFVPQNIVMSKPGQRQRYYYRYDGGTEGYVRFKLFPSNIPNLKPKDPAYTYDYVARYQKIGAGSEVVAETPLTWDSNPMAPKAVFTVPQNTLESEQLYIIQIVRKKVLKNKNVGGFKVNFGGGGGGGLAKYAPKGGGGFDKNGPKGGGGEGAGEGGPTGPQSYTDTKGIGDGQTIDIKKQRIDNIRLGDDEFMVYQIAFKTSKFTTLNNKLKSYIKASNLAEEYKGEGWFENTLYAEYKGDEALGWYDLKEITYSKGNKTERIAPLLQVTAKDHSNSNSIFWQRLRTNYLDQINDPFLNDKIRFDLGFNPGNTGLNPRTIRTYPSTNAYLPGSRLTRGTRLDALPFPVNAVGISYSGTGNTGRLTDQEIGATFWKDYQPEPDLPKLMLQGQAVKAATQIQAQPKNGGGGMMMGNNVYAPQDINRMVIRYDVITILRVDQKKLADELFNRAVLSWSIFRFENSYLVFEKYNMTSRIGVGGNNPHYQQIKFLGSSYYPVQFSFRVGNMSGLPNGGEVRLFD